MGCRVGHVFLPARESAWALSRAVTGGAADQQFGSTTKDLAHQSAGMHQVPVGRDSTDPGSCSLSLVFPDELGRDL